MTDLVSAIDREVRTLPPKQQHEVLDFIGYLRAKYEQPADPRWLERAWGASPDFPDRAPQPPLTEVGSLP